MALPSKLKRKMVCEIEFYTLSFRQYTKAVHSKGKEIYRATHNLTEIAYLTFFSGQYILRGS
jgi:hypothetical protein